MSVSRMSRVLRRIARDDDGLGMSEILVALMVFAVIATTAAYGMLNALTLTQHSRSSETAMSLASSDLDQMRLLASAGAYGVLNVVSTGPSVTKTVGGTTYSIDRAVSWQTTTGATGACGTGAGTLQYKNVTDTVSWRGANGATQSIRMSSAIAPLSNINSDATGTIIVTVIGAQGQPMPGLKVTVAPTAGGGGSALSTSPQNTDNSGCSFGLLVTPGSYTVTASTSGGIDVQGNASASTTAVVVAGQNTVVKFTYDLAGTFPLSYPVGATLPTNLPVTFWNATAQITGSGTSVKAFPFSPDGYTILAGSYVYNATSSSSSCLDTNPGAWATPRASDGAVGTAPPTVATAAGTTAPTTSVAMGTMTLGNVSSLQGKYLTAISASTPGDGDPGCAAGQTLTFGKIPSVSSMTLALPFGTWRLYAGSTSGSTSTPLPSGTAGTLTPISAGTVNAVTSTTSSITFDPRTVPTS